MADSPSFHRHPHHSPSISSAGSLPPPPPTASSPPLSTTPPLPPPTSTSYPLPTHPPQSPPSRSRASRATALRCSPTALAAATSSGSVHLVPSSFDSGSALAVQGGAGFHVGPIRGLDCSGEEWVTAGEDGRVHVVVGGADGRVAARRVWDGKGMAGYEAAKWASTAEFATGGAGCGVQWWDRRKGDAVVAQCNGVWGHGIVTGMVHSLDIHPSRKHICVVGGSSGTIFAWDLRWPQQPIPLSGAGLNGTAQPVCESEVWEVLFDTYTQSSDMISSASTRILPVMMCSEDGILAVVEQGILTDERPLELLAEPCAINSFDIDPQNPSDVVCALEWESIGVLTRGTDTMAEE